MKKIGIILIAIGLLMTLYTGFAFIRSERVAGLGDFVLTKDNRHIVNWQPYAGIVAMVIGGIVIVLSVNRKDEGDLFKK